MNTRIEIVPGIALPFYPMRPTPYVSIHKDNLQDILALKDRYILQPKLNGKRVCLAKMEDKISLYSRHGSEFSFNIDNRDPFTRMVDGTVLDGEVWQKNFYPFEVLALNGDSLTAEGPEVRIAYARKLVRSLGLPWIFNTPSTQWLTNLRDNLPHWEGVVAKKKGSSYVMLGSATRNSPTWLKLKWR